MTVKISRAAACLSLALFFLAMRSARADALGGGLEGLNCADFKMNSDGTWSSVRAVRLSGIHGPFTVQPGMTFGLSTESDMYGVKVTKALNKRCRPY